IRGSIAFRRADHKHYLPQAYNYTNHPPPLRFSPAPNSKVKPTKGAGGRDASRSRSGAAHRRSFRIRRDDGGHVSFPTMRCQRRSIGSGDGVSMRRPDRQRRTGATASRAAVAGWRRLGAARASRRAAAPG
ncbi:hypothetical protein THAOC_15996, partial [Thalassiosira oceanica]